MLNPDIPNITLSGRNFVIEYQETRVTAKLRGNTSYNGTTYDVTLEKICKDLCGRVIRAEWMYLSGASPKDPLVLNLNLGRAMERRVVVDLAARHDNSLLNPGKYLTLYNLLEKYSDPEREERRGNDHYAMPCPPKGNRGLDLL
jgi:hypothetical protein